MSEWSNEHAWKVCVPLGTVGSNPTPSTISVINSCCSMIFRYGVAKGYCSRDITQDYKGMLKNGKTKHMPH